MSPQRAPVAELLSDGSAKVLSLDECKLAAVSYRPGYGFQRPFDSSTVLASGLPATLASTLGDSSSLNSQSAISL